MTLLRDEPCVEARMDTWRNRSYAAAWHWSSPSWPSGSGARQHNLWAARQLEAVFLALWPFARVRTVVIDASPDAPTIPCRSWTWTASDQHQGFEEHVIGAVKAAQAAVTNVDLELDLHAWTRTAESPVAPVRGWICSSASASLVFESEDSGGSLRLGHTLFLDGQLHGDSNHELHCLNKPLLRETLARIETQLGPIVEVEGLPGISRTGFDSIV